LAKYPQGQQSVDPWLRDTPMKDGEKQETTYAYVRNPSTVPGLANKMEYHRTMDAFSSAAEEDPASAIANASRIPDAATRSRVLVGIARTCQSKNAGAARSALREALKSPPENQDTPTWKDAAEIAIRLGDLNSARAAVDAGLKAARRVYDEDSDSDTPNLALKAYWPSVQAYRDIVAVQAKISPDEAMDTVKDLPDPEVAALEKAMLAAAWLNARLSNTSPMVAKRASESGPLTGGAVRVEFVSLIH
jgi:tetratricopeptide (TPR) repeat protein